jgi:hypothetical protein
MRVSVLRTPTRACKSKYLTQTTSSQLQPQPKSIQENLVNLRRHGAPPNCQFSIGRVSFTVAPSARAEGAKDSPRLWKRSETETPDEHVAGSVGGGETAPSRAVSAPVVDHGVRRGRRDDACVC